MHASSKTKFKFNKSTLTLIRAIHVYVSMALLVMMLFFAITGITLNHPTWFDAKGITKYQEDALPAYLFTLSADEQQQALSHYVGSSFAMDYSTAQISPDEIQLVHKGPGSYKTLTLDLVEKQSYFEQIDYGLIAILNDLHKGRNSGKVWAFILDLCAILIILFSISGALLLVPQQKRLKKSISYMLFATGCCALVYFTLIP
ncbi:PepSY-associated TM helix domain-containing protein [Pseudoalteromonas tunicata]|uniref:Peptidase n=1 Tax=Pseudoalteromonas tunicata D2 TaxID=87626 RepID=A4CER7_9GAMM|nr:PepSY-associated TM helix domain-containing protein [Pseudoalteromonas tunicata]AXT31586.1 peptidase [Pseudoalteromonas tunicata]EAR26796.1 hypothetical protein PTD2_16666 [Pseudoalteromonas tunicata D2]